MLEYDHRGEYGMVWIKDLGIVHRLLCHQLWMAFGRLLSTIESKDFLCCVQADGIEKGEKRRNRFQWWTLLVSLCLFH